MNSLAAIVIATRRETGWTQAKLAAELGVTRSQVSNWESGKSDMPASTLLRLFDLLGTPRLADVLVLPRSLQDFADELEADAERAYQRSCGYRDEHLDGQYRAYDDAAERLRAIITSTKESR